MQKWRHSRLSHCKSRSWQPGEMVAFARAFVCAVCVSAFAADNNSHDNNRLCYVNYVKRVQSTSSANSFLCIFYEYLWGIGANGMAVVCGCIIANYKSNTQTMFIFTNSFLASDNSLHRWISMEATALINRTRTFWLTQYTYNHVGAFHVHSYREAIVLVNENDFNLKLEWNMEKILLGQRGRGQWVRAIFFTSNSSLGRIGRNMCSTLEWPNKRAWTKGRCTDPQKDRYKAKVP